MSHTQWQHRYSVENECHVYVSERSRCWCTAVWTGIEASNDFQGNNHWLGGTNLTDDPLSSSANSASVSLLQVRYGVFPFSFSFPFLLETPASELLDVYTTTIYRRQNKYTPYIRKIHRAVNQKSQVRRLLHGVWFNTVMIMFKFVIIQYSYISRMFPNGWMEMEELAATYTSLLHHWRTDQDEADKTRECIWPREMTGYSCQAFYYTRLFFLVSN